MATAGSTFPGDSLAIVKPPIKTNSTAGFDSAIIQEDAKSTRIVVHSRFQDLVERFLAHKREHGSSYEKEVYTTSFTWRDQVSRLIEKRPLVFMGHSDYTVLRDGTRPRGNVNDEWDRNGTDEQLLNKYLTLKEYLSYDEIMLGSLIGVSSPSFFINDGNRFNQGKHGEPNKFEPRGIIVGLVGPRFERGDRMDSIHILPPESPSHQHKALSKIFQEWFGAKRNPQAHFDFSMYRARMRITVDILLLEANSRAQETGRKAYTYVVGLGLGVWARDDDQAEHYVETFVSALQELQLPNITTLEFSWINVPDACKDHVTNAAAQQGIKVIFSKRNPAEKLETDELLVLSYAWDGNAFPGNEYWDGSLCGSGDPAAACMSCIGELHNPIINPFTHQIKVLQS